MPIGAMAPPEAMLFSQLHSTHLIETARLQQHSFFFVILKDMWHMQTAQC